MLRRALGGRLTKDANGGGRGGLTALAMVGALALGCAQTSDPNLGAHGQKASALARSLERTNVRALGANGPRTIAWRPDAASPHPSDFGATARALLDGWLRQRGAPAGAAPKWLVAGVTSARDRRVVTLAHSVNGVPVWQARTSVLLSADGQPRAVSGLPDLRSTIGEFHLSSAEAAQLAWQHQRPDASAELEFVGLGADGLERFELKTTLTSGPSLLGPVRVSRVYFPAAVGLLPAFAVVMGSQAAGQDRRGGEIVVSAQDGSILAVRITLASAHSYRVWTADAAGTPAEGPLASVLPYPTSEPSGFSPLPAASKLVAVDGLNTNPDGAADPWLPADATTTLGNNVDAYVDHQDPDGLSGGEFRAQVTGAGTFDHSYDLGEGPLFDTTQSSAAIVQAFYTANWLHDWYYDSGFDEAAMNAQTDNFGRGGFGADVLTIQVQDAALNAQPGGNNANMYTPPDGESPIMQVYVWSAPPGGVERDGALDGTIVAHEWGHYLQDRLAPCWPTAIDYNTYTPEPSQCHAMGEGGGDFVALHMLLAEDDDPADVYPMAAYAAAALVPDLYYGLRRTPYSTTLEVDPLTFHHIENGVALPPGVAAAGPNSEVHNAGEVWTTMLFEVYAALLAEGGGPDNPSSFEEIRRNMSDDLVLALSMMPYERTMLDARDAVLAAIAARSESDALAAAQAFAKRGAGSCAVAPPFDSITNGGVVEDFEVSPRLEVGLAWARDEQCDNEEDGVLDAGETGALVVEVVNLGHGAASDVTVGLSDLPTELAALEGAELTLDVPGLGTTLAEFPITLAGVTEIVDGSVTVTIEGDESCSPAPEVTRSFAANYDVDEAGGSSDDFAADLGAWTLLGAKADTIWTRSGVGESALWHGEDAETRTSSALVSPAVEVSPDEPFEVTLTHRYSFEASSGINWDGGVIEISEDDGATWVDASEIPGVDVGYSGSVTSESYNPLTADTGSPRPAFVGDSASYPSFESLSIDFGDGLAGKTIRIAFRIGSDQQVGAPGWAIDDVSFSGVARGPFQARALDTTAPSPCPEPLSSGGSGSGGEGDGSSGSGGTAQAATGGQASATTGGSASGGGGGAGPVEAPGGCGCRVARTSSSGASVLGFGLLGLTLLWRRRRGVPSARATSAA